MRGQIEIANRSNDSSLLRSFVFIFGDNGIMPRNAFLVALLLFSLSATAAELRETQTIDGVRIATVYPAGFDSKMPTDLLIYGCPNGNSIEQTLGCRLEPGMDWHFDIQHIAAQTRFLQKLDATRNLVLAVIEADVKSFPAWRRARADNGKVIRNMVEQIAAAVPGDAKKITLAGHSGGGSFIFGFLNGGDAIPDIITRIIWLDANYAYDDAENHGDKLLAWLAADASRHLIVFAYNDRVATLNGKPFVSETGGTFYRSKKMLERFGKDLKITQTPRGEFEEYIALNGQIRFLLHPNPEKKILHTVLVERNGVIEAMTMGTPLENKWGGQFWGPRIYSDLIEAAPTTQPTTKPSSINARAANAMGGKMFSDTIADLPPKAREAAIVAEIIGGNIPDFSRKFVPITVKVGGHTCVIEVMSDYLAVGSDDDFVRMPMTPASATAIAKAFGCTLPTRKMVNDIYEQAEVKLEPKPLTEQREAVRTFVQHNQIIEQQRVGTQPPARLGQLSAGHKKDIVITPRLKEKPNKVAIYGWQKPDGKPIQPLYVGHADYYVDYSHGVRLIKREVLVDGVARDIFDLLKNAELCGVVSDEGVTEAGAATYE